MNMSTLLAMFSILNDDLLSIAVPPWNGENLVT